MRTPSKIIVAVALAGIAVAGGAAFTGVGVDITGSSQASAAQFIGGAVKQTVTQGVSLENVEYKFTDGDYGHNAVTGVVLTFTNPIPGTALTMVQISTGPLGEQVPVTSTWTTNATASPLAGSVARTIWTSTGTFSITPDQLNVIVSPLNEG